MLKGWCHNAYFQKRELSKPLLQFGLLCENVYSYAVNCSKMSIPICSTAPKCLLLFVLLCQNVCPHLFYAGPRSAIGRGPGFGTRSGNILSFLLPLFQEGQLSVTGESMCTKYWLAA